MSDQYTNPKSWGPHFWFIMRCIANNYSTNPTKEETSHVRNFIMELQYVLPCEVCKYTFKQHYNRNPLDKYLANNDKLMEWVEIIYQETKKVIQDKRIKIIDSFEEVSEVALPMRTVYKNKTFDPIAARLDEIRKKATEQKKIEDKNMTNIQQIDPQKISDISKYIVQLPKLEQPKQINPPPIIDQHTLPAQSKLEPPKPIVQPKIELHKPIVHPKIEPPKPIVQPKVEPLKPIVPPKIEPPKSNHHQEKSKHKHKIEVESTIDSPKIPYAIPNKFTNINNKPINIEIPKNTVLKKDKKNDITAQSLPTIKKDFPSVTKPHIKQFMPKTHIASKIHAPPLVVTKRCRKCDDKAQ